MNGFLYGKEYIVKQSKRGFDSAELNNSMVHDEQEPYEREVRLIFMFRLNLFGIPLVNQKETVSFVDGNMVLRHARDF